MIEFSEDFIEQSLKLPLLYIYYKIRSVRMYSWGMSLFKDIVSLNSDSDLIVKRNLQLKCFRMEALKK